MPDDVAAKRIQLESLVGGALALADELGLIAVGIHLDSARIELAADVAPAPSVRRPRSSVG